MTGHLKTMSRERKLKEEGIFWNLGKEIWRNYFKIRYSRGMVETNLLRGQNLNYLVISKADCVCSDKKSGWNVLGKSCKAVTSCHWLICRVYSPEMVVVMLLFPSVSFWNFLAPKSLWGALSHSLTLTPSFLFSHPFIQILLKWFRYTLPGGLHDPSKPIITHIFYILLSSHPHKECPCFKPNGYNLA